jgi:uncharacterized protein YuzE
VKVKYDPDSGAVYIRLRDRPIVETEEITPGLLMDIAEDGLPVGFDVLNAALLAPAQPAPTAKESLGNS